MRFRERVFRKYPRMKEFYYQDVDSLILVTDPVNNQILRKPYRSASLSEVLLNSGLNRRMGQVIGYWSMDEQGGTRHGWGPPVEAQSSHLVESNYLGGVTPIAAVAGIQSRGYAASFGNGQYLSTRVPEMFDDRVALNCYCKLSLTDVTFRGTPIVVLCPPQSPRRHFPADPGNFFGIGVVKVGSGYYFTAYAGYIFENGTTWIDSVGSGVPLSADTYYQVCAFTSHDVDGTGTVLSNRKINISVNNNVNSANRGDDRYFVRNSPTLYVGENPAYLGAGLLTNTPAGLAVDNVGLWYATNFGSIQLGALFNGGRGFDPTTALIQKAISWWSMDESSGSKRLDSIDGPMGALSEYDPVGRATGQFLYAADFPADSAVYLYTRHVQLPLQGLSIAGWVLLDQVGPARALQAIVGWLDENNTPSKHRGFRIYYKQADGFVFEIGDATNTLKFAKLNPSGGVLSGTWYFIAAGYDADGTNWIQVNNEGREVGDDAVVPSQHLKLLMFGRDYGGAQNIPALDGRLDSWGLYTPALNQDDYATLIAQGFFPW